MYILMNDLYKELSGADKVLIYGAGSYANIVYPMLKKVGLKEKICAFIVTDLKETMEIDGIPVKSADELDSFKVEEYEVLVAVRKEFEQEIIESLRLFHFVQILKLSDYILSEDDLTEAFRSQTCEQFLERFIEAYVWNNNGWTGELEDKRIEIEKMMKQRKDACIDTNTIVFVLGNFPPRTAKIIGALKRKKYNVVVLEYRCDDDLVIHELTPYDIEIFHCGDIIEVFYRAMQYNPLVYYCEPIWGDCRIPEIMIRNKDLFGKIVFTTYDVLNDGYVCVTEEQKLSERYSLENADGIVWRWYSKEFLEEVKGFAYKGRSIQFLDYCNGYKIEEREEIGNELKLCFITGGTYGLLDGKVYKNDGSYVEMARMDSVMKKIGKRKDCLFHVYIGEINEEEREKFNTLAEEYPNFNFFCGIKHDELIQKISEYDYGCFWTTDGVSLKDLEADGIGFTGSNYVNSIPHRYFDYIDAGIAVIAVLPKKLCDFLDEQRVLVKMDISNMDIDYLKENKKIYKENVKKAKNTLLIDNHIQRLIDFLENL